MFSYMLLVLRCSAGMAAMLFVEQLCYCTTLLPSVPAATFCAAEVRDFGCYNFCYNPFGCLYLDCCRIWLRQTAVLGRGAYFILIFFVFLFVVFSCTGSLFYLYGLQHVFILCFFMSAYNSV
ncbi:hypothetical protein CsSME_00049120 [Camellia sinensis var. sinensis]